MARSLNKVQLIGNLTRDPELRYTPQGNAVCTFTIATNRQWTTDSGERKEEAEFHRVVAWNKLAEICGQMLKKGTRTFVEGRLQTRQWEGQDGSQKTTTEVVVSDMIVLDSRRDGAQMVDEIPDDFSQVPTEPAGEAQPIPQEDQSQEPQEESPKPAKKTKKEAPQEKPDETDDIPF